MMDNMVKVRIFGIEGISAKDELYDASSLDELFTEICRKYGINREMLSDCIIFVNGRNIAADNYMNINLKCGDNVQFLATIVGG